MVDLTEQPFDVTFMHMCHIYLQKV